MRLFDAAANGDPSILDLFSRRPAALTSSLTLKRKKRTAWDVIQCVTILDRIPPW